MTNPLDEPSVTAGTRAVDSMLKQGYPFVIIESSNEVAPPRGFLCLPLLDGSESGKNGWIHAHYSQISSYGPEMLMRVLNSDERPKSLGTRIVFHDRKPLEVSDSIAIIARKIAFARKEEESQPMVVICPNCQREMVPDFVHNEWKCLVCKSTMLAKYSPHPF